MNRGKAESCSRIKDKNMSLALGQDDVRRIWKEDLEDLYNIYTQEQNLVHMFAFDNIQRGNCFEGKPIRKTEVEMRVRKLKSGKAAGDKE